jgi:hypothetical protein
MKSLLALSAACLIAVPAAAEAPAISAAFAQIMEPRSVVSMRDVDAYFERPADARADALLLPLRFCVKRVGTTQPEDAITPFNQNGYGIVEGAPAAGARKHISGGSRRADGGWDLVVDLYRGRDGEVACGRLSRAFAAIYFSVDAAGRPIAGPVEVRGFMMDGSSRCRTPMASVQLDYRLSP